VSLVTGEVDRGPVIESLMVDQGGIAALAFLQNGPGLVVLPLLAVLPESVVVAVDLHPEIFPVDGHMLHT